MRRCRHAAASEGSQIYIYGGLKGGKDTLLGDLLIAENSQSSDLISPVLSPERTSRMMSPRANQSNITSFTRPYSVEKPDVRSSGCVSMDKKSKEKLTEAAAAEAQAANAVWQAVQSKSSPPEETSVSDDNSQAAETTSEGSDTDSDVHLHPRAVVVAKEDVGNLGGIFRQLSSDQFENESRRMLPTQN